MTSKLLAAALAAFAVPALAEPFPWPEPPGPGGSCPHGYFTCNGYCVPSQGAQTAIPKRGGSCPWGWASSGDFCVKNGDSR
jgi:hypothetical protein